MTPARTPRRTPSDLIAKDEKGVGNSPLVLFDKFKDVDKAALLKQIKEEGEKSKREEKQAMEREFEDMKRKGDDPYKTIVKPQYQLDPLLNVYREINIPPNTLYIGLGFDDVPDDNRKHYRRYFADELENISELLPKPQPFDTYYLKRGQTRGASKSLWPFSSAKEDESGSVDTEQVVGRFKCIIDIESEKEKKEHAEQRESKMHELKLKLNALSIKKTKKAIDFNIDEIATMEGKMRFRTQMDNLGVGHLEIEKFISDMHTQALLKRLLLAKCKNIVRLYVISAYDLASRDNNSPSDPYLYITLGSKIYNDSKNYILDEPNPDFHKVFDFEAVFPGCAPLSIQVFDYDDLFGDDLIGETQIDLEDRFFN